MNIKASGRWALIVTAALWLGCAAPMRAAEGDAATSDSTAQTDGTTDDATAAQTPVTQIRPAKPKPKKRVEAPVRKPGKVTARTSEATLPSVANANAQFPAGDNALKTMSAPAQGLLRTAGQASQTDPQTTPAANAEAASANEPNEADRSVSQETPNQFSPSLERPRGPNQAMAAGQNSSVTSGADSTWSQTSLPGKIFVALGGLLTVASAARMFMA
jgi:hypothetical protein